MIYLENIFLETLLHERYYSYGEGDIHLFVFKMSIMAHE